ncbi:hypothetical protein ECC02_000036 [Trypanosoma cruzi]|uniref:BSD domain-containing protein n=1 Tax=Trypanosoma cruzi TaxID=5693 RepID=A0A7J6YIL4_TRYCR|nr:hypothetical protein ECC02_000036 [Trypanosoma cruzi]
MFDALSALVETASAKAKLLTEEGYELVKQTGMLELEEGYDDTNCGTTEVKCKTAPAAECVTSKESEGPCPAVTRVTKDLFFLPPSQWESPAEEWTLLAESALMEENSCIIPPERILGEESLVSKLCGLLNVDSIEKLPEIPKFSECKPSQELVDWLTSETECIEFRSLLVPRHVSDEQYWVNTCWRFFIYRMCRNGSQLLDVMEVVSIEPKPVDTTGVLRKKRIGVPNNATHWKKLRETLNCRREMAAWIEEQISTVQHEIELALSNLQLLTNITMKRETTELGDSVSESCKYHKAKLDRLMGELKLQREKLGESVLCPDHGSLFAQLANVNDQLRVKLEVYASLSSGNPSECRENVSHGGREEATLKTSPSGGDHDDTTVFEAVLPWEKEGEEG